MSEYTVPSLGTDGAITDPNLAVIRLYLYFATSEKSQTAFYGDNVASLKYILANNDENETIIEEVIKSLTRLYNRYFKNTEVYVEVSNDDNSNIRILNINVETYDNENKLELSQAVKLENNTIQYLDNNILDLYKGR